MKATILTIAVVLLALAGAPVIAQEAGDLPDREADVVLMVEGFACQFCADRLAKALGELEGVEAMDWSGWRAGTVGLWLEAGADASDDLLATTVTESGFKLKEVRRTQG